jgi:hypothetical protein
MDPTNSCLQAEPLLASPSGDDTVPLPGRLRAAAVIGIVGSIVALVAVIAAVPAAGKAWEVVSRETERTLEPVLGEPEHQTLRMLASLVGSDLDETLSASSRTPH